MKIELPIYHGRDNAAQLKMMGAPLTAMDIRYITFYQITAVGTGYDEQDYNREFSIIYANGDVFYCSLTALEVNNLLISQTPKFTSFSKDRP